MGARDYQVILSPVPDSNPGSDSSVGQRTLDDVLAVASALQTRWSAIKPDEKASYNADREYALVYETETELFQILVMLEWHNRYVYVSLRFAYCNPRSIYDPFCTLIEWLMYRYHLDCMPMRELGRSVEGTVIAAYPIKDPAEIRSVLIPSMDHMRNNWQQWIGSSEEAKLRPWEARVHFRRSFNT